MRSGILEPVLMMMKIDGAAKDTFQKLCVISFDEVKVQDTLEYDQQADEFIGPHRQMQVNNL